MELIKIFRRANNLSQTDLAEYLGVTQAFISQIEKGVSQLPENSKTLILANDKGWDTSMLTEKVAYNMSDSDALAHFQELYFDRILHDKEKQKEMVPVIPSKLCKESGVDVVDYVKNNCVSMAPQVDQFPATSHFLRVTSNAMAPMFLPGDMLALKLMEPDTPIVNGEVYVINTDKVGMVLRYIYDEGDHLRLHSCSEHYTDFILSKNQVLGLFRVVGLIRTDF